MRVGNIHFPQEAIEAFCRRWRITELAVFGSALRDDFRPDSDIDLLVQFSPDARWTLLDFVRMQDELSAILGRRVDLVSRKGIERSKNARRRKSILDSAEVIYVA